MCWVQRIESFEVPHGRGWSHLDDPPRVSLPDLCASSKMENTQMPLGRSLLPPPKSPLCRSRGACEHKEECAEWCDDDGTAPPHVLSLENASKGPASSGFRSVSASLAFVFDSPRENHSLCGRSTHACMHLPPLPGCATPTGILRQHVLNSTETGIARSRL
jgi:hypothetical protein